MMGDVTLDDQYGEIYSQREAKLYGELRKDVYGEDFGQFCWSPVSEQDRFIAWLELSAESKFLDVGCGSGGPTVRIVKSTGCQATGIDVSEEAIHVANVLAQREGLSDRMDFQLVDATQGYLLSMADSMASSVSTRCSIFPTETFFSLNGRAC